VRLSFAIEGAAEIRPASGAAETQGEQQQDDQKVSTA
jgi:hypothetical protein